LTGLRFVVVADSHIRFPDDDVETYPSNSLMVARNEFVVDVCNHIGPAFIVHLGDIVHPLPVEDAHEAAVRLAAGVYARLEAPIRFVAGNHDIGDKPNAYVAVPPVAEENYGVFERFWGEPYQSFNLGDFHFTLIDTPVLNSGFQRELEQRAWLESDLAEASAAGRRTFLFTHYPPFIREPNENVHYDNLAEPARSWLLDLIEQHQVEAVFSGHVHNFLYNHLGGTEFYVLPSTGFTRPDYSELAAVPPDSENGRDDPAKLGFFVIDVLADGHRVTPIRTNGAAGEVASLPVQLATSLDSQWRSPVGVTLRHAWMSDVDFPTAGLDEFTRKTVRNDATLPALWEARITALRIPIGDAATPEARERLRHLAGRGARFTLVSAGVPDDPTLRIISALDGMATRWEIAAPAGSFDQVAAALAIIDGKVDLPVAVGPITPVGSSDEAVHHFVSTGFAPQDDPLVDEWAGLDTARSVRELVFRIAPEAGISGSVANADRAAREAGYSAVVLIDLPRSSESTTFEDDQALADRVAESVEAAFACPEAAVFLDSFMDHDRSYYPRHGLIDRHHNPRPALFRLIECSATGERPAP
jgi:3',5'-cyclic AMP phosphodiesterase CpdA